MIGRRLAIPLVVVGSVAVGGIAGALIGVPGLSGASTPAVTQSQATGPAGAPDKPHCGPKSWLDAAAKALNMTTDELRQQLSDGKTTIADVAGQKNISVDDVVKAISDANQQCIQDFVNHPFPGWKGPNGHDKHGGPGWFGIAGRFGAGDVLDAAAKALNTTPGDLRQELRNGKSIADVAKEKNVDVNVVINDMVAAADARIDKAKDDGKLTTDQATKLKSMVNDAITNFVNGTYGPGKSGIRGLHGLGHWGFGGPGGAPNSPAGP